MPLAIPSGLSGLLTDAREFLAAVRFARPGLLWLLLVLPVLAAANRYAAYRRRRAVAGVGRPAAVAGLSTDPRPRRRWLGLAYPLAWAALILGLAGPRWGKSDEPGVAVGRDLVLVVDLSRSMQADDVRLPEGGWRVPSKQEEEAAEQEVKRAERAADPTRLKVATERMQTVRRERREPKRWRAARDAALDLLDGVARRGGHRVAVIVFAAEPHLLCPLTTDYDHVRAAIARLNGDHPPPECRGGFRARKDARGGASPHRRARRPRAEPVSGTRIGAALEEAVDTHDDRFPGSQDILLLSDGDDPGEDQEWQFGADAAREAGIPVHVVGFGDPDQPTPIVVGEGEGQTLVPTQLREGPLRQIAAETRGEYLPARRELPQLGEFFRTRIEPYPTRLLSDEKLPQPKERFAWFLAPALALFSVGWLRGR
jgi:Ca-activated chloride channel family protein